MSLFPVLQHTCARCASHTQHEVGLGREVGLGLSTLALDSIQGPSALHFSDPSVSLENRRWEPMWAGTHMDVEWSENPLVEVGGGFGSCRPHSSACPLSLPSVFQQHLRIAVLLWRAGSGRARQAFRSLHPGRDPHTVEPENGPARKASFLNKPVVCRFHMGLLQGVYKALECWGSANLFHCSSQISISLLPEVSQSALRYFWPAMLEIPMFGT